MSSLSRRTFNAGVVAGAAASLAAQSRRPPNILFICSDQHSGRVMGCNGHPVVRTPHMDRLAGMGVLFRNAYTGSPVCAPGRAGMMSGRYPSDVESFCNSTPMGHVPSWGNYLRDAGYACRAYGKMDLTSGVDYGFEESGVGAGHSERPDITSLFRTPVCFRPGERANVNGEFTEREHHDVRVTSEAVKQLKQPRGAKPWALYVGLTQPHPKWVALPRYRDVYPPDKMPLPVIPEGYLEARHTFFQIVANFKNIQSPIPKERVQRARAAYYGMVSELDEHIGMLLDQLERSGEMQNTLVVYTADHGEMLGEHGLWLKNVLLENAARVPLILAGAGLPKGKTVDTPVSHVDMVATMLDLAGSQKPPNARGTSLVGLANGKADSHPGFTYSESHSESNCTGSFMLRKGDWKYLYFTGDVPLLFNLKDDPGELRNLAGRPETAAIQKQLHQHLTSLVDPDTVTRRAFDAQERVLMNMVRNMKRDEFYEEISGRLGRAQAWVLTSRHYPVTPASRA
jgi:choline-sulfatase